jgi:hypothetical protein
VPCKNSLTKLLKLLIQHKAKNAPACGVSFQNNSANSKFHPQTMNDSATIAADCVSTHIDSTKEKGGPQAALPKRCQSKAFS